MEREHGENIETDLSAQKSTRNFECLAFKVSIPGKMFRTNNLKKGRNIFEKNAMRRWRA